MTEITTSPAMQVDRQRGWRIWPRSAIFVPGGAGGLFVPNIDDMIIQYAADSYLVEKVIDVDYTTGQSTTQLIHEVPLSSTATNTDIILSAAPGRPAEAFRAYVDRSVKPATISFDRRMFVLGTMSRSVMIFKGTNIGAGGQVISAMYDQGNTLLGESIPLETVATVRIPDAGTVAAVDSAVKVVATGYLSQEVIDNEVVTLVLYDDAGNIVQTQSVVVYNTSFARQPDTSRRYVKDVRLKSSFLSEGDDTNLLVPRNVPLDSILTFGEVIYSNGDTLELPIDGTKFVLHGLYSNRYIANSDGYRASLVLTYRLDPNEFLYGASVGEVPHMSKKYTVETAPFEKVFGARIWAYPQWISSLAGYRMRYYFSTLSRDRIYDITSLVRLSVNSPVFEPLLFGTRQNLILEVDMNKIDPAFKAFKFVQPTSVVLYAAGNDPGTCYSVNYAPSGAVTFGVNLKALGDYRSAGFWLLDVSQSAGSRDDWLDRMYYNTLPLFNPTNELRAPAPTHFKMSVAGTSTEYEINNWANPLQVAGDPYPGESVVFEWILRDGTGDHALGVSAIPFYQVS